MTLVRALGRWSMAALVLNGIIGSGVFVLPGTVGGSLGWASIAAWTLAAGFTGAMIFCFAEVASRFSGSGGAYLFTRAAFGPFVALQIGWLSYFVRAISAAVQANLFSTYLAEFLPWAGTRAGGFVISTLFIGVLAAINIRSVISGARVSNAFALVKITPLLAFGVLGLMWIASGKTVAQATAADPTVGGWLQALLLLMFAYGGFETAVIPLAEAKDPGRDAPFALLVGLGLVTLVYLAAQLTVLATLPDPDATNRPLAASMRAMLGPSGAAVITLAALISVYGWLATNMLTVPRLGMAMAERGDFPSVLARVHPKFRTPWVSVLVFAGVSWVLANQAGLIQNLSLSAVSRLFVYGLVCAALPVFRRRESRVSGDVGPARFRAPGGMALATIGIAAAAVLAARMNAREAVTMVGLVALASLHWLVRRRGGSHVRAGALTLLAAGGAALTPLEAQMTNLGFEEVQSVGGRLVPAGWMTRGDGYEITVDTTTSVDGRASLRSRRTDPAPVTRGGTFAVAIQRYSRFAAAGRSLRLTGWIRTEEVTAGYAGLWIRVDGEGGRMLALENMASRGPRGTTPWTRYEVEVPVDSSATGVVFGVLHPGSGTAWFDSLGLDVVGPASGARSAGGRGASTPGRFEPPPRPAEDLTRLLTDAELATPPDSAAPAENAAWAAWVREHARPIRSLGARDFSDLRFLAPLLAGKRVVQLGESAHGVREFNMAKVRLIQYLHEELGYDVLAFESPLFECDRAGRAAASLPAVQLMRRCIFSVWHTEELVPLFEYLRSTQTTARPLVLTGFDVQVMAMRSAERSAFLRRVVAAVDRAYASRVHEVDSSFVPGGYVENEVYARGARDRLVAFYDSLATWLRARERTLAERLRSDPAAPILARQTAVSMSVLVRQVAAGQGREGFELRDRGMADNLDFILNELHPGKKVIVWAHNSHVQHRGYGGAARPESAAGAPRTMGTYVAERHRLELYTVGLYMYRGTAARNNRVAYAVTPATTGSLESILHRASWRYAFVDLSRAERGPGTEWMFRQISAKTWGTRPEQLVPRDEYDAIVFIDRTWPPQYLR